MSIDWVQKTLETVMNSKQTPPIESAYAKAMYKTMYVTSKGPPPYVLARLSEPISMARPRRCRSPRVVSTTTTRTLSVGDDAQRHLGRTGDRERQLDRRVAGRGLAEPTPDGNAERQDFHERAGRLALKLGLLRYALEADDRVIRGRFREAAAHLTHALVLRPPAESDTHRRPWKAEQFVNVIGCFGSDAERSAVAALREWQYRAPVQAEHETIARYVRVLCGLLGGAPLDAPTLEALTGIADACDAPTAGREEYLYLLPTVRGLLAVHAGDADAWNYALARVVSAHGRDARSGDLELLPDGLVCLRGLLLAKRGLHAGLELRAASPYLPLFLLDEGGEA